MWYIGQLVQNQQGGRALYAGFDMEKTPATAYFKLKDGELELFRASVSAYKELPCLPGGSIPIGKFAQELRGGFLGEIDLAKLAQDPVLYAQAVLTLKAGA